MNNKQLINRWHEGFRIKFGISDKIDNKRITEMFNYYINKKTDKQMWSKLAECEILSFNND